MSNTPKDAPNQPNKGYQFADLPLLLTVADV